MAKITFIGAGSYGFTTGLIRDILTFDTMKDSTVSLMDIDKKRLANIKEVAEHLIQKAGSKIKIEATTDRKKALKNSDAVIITILAGDVDVWRHDIEIPKKFGVDINVGDTRGVAGIFRALRTAPVMLDICRDIEKLCPDAIVFNYTNPMAMLCRAIQRQTGLLFTGLCHSVQGTAEMLAEWIKAPMNEITYVCAGINHMAWYLEFKWNGKDAYPLIRQAVKRKKNYEHELVRNEMFKALGYYVTESSGHNSEYSWWFRKRPDLIEKYCIHGTGWNPGKYAYIRDEYLKMKKVWQSEKRTRKAIEELKQTPLDRGHEYAISIINAYLGGGVLEFNGNVSNTGLIPNLPNDCCVEVPCTVNTRGVNPMYVGPLPAQLAALNNITAASEEMAVEAAITGNAELVYQAICYDPLSAAVLSLAEIRKMVKRMLTKNQPYLPQFKSIDI